MGLAWVGLTPAPRAMAKAMAMAMKWRMTDLLVSPVGSTYGGEKIAQKGKTNQEEFDRFCW